MNKRSRFCLIAVVMPAAIGEVSADGAAPLLLIINFTAFLLGGVLIVLIESLVFRLLARVRYTQAFADSLLVNVESTILIGVGLPLLLFVSAGLSSYILPSWTSDLASVVLAMDPPSRELLPLTLGMTALWFLITFILTVYYEASRLRERWASLSPAAVVAPRTVSWAANGTTYAGIAGAFCMYLYFT